MKRIEIYERDITVANNPSLITDIAFVPGFAMEANKVQARIPVYCDTLAKFKEYFGSRVPKFEAAQAYPSEFPQTENDVVVPLNIDGDVTTVANMFESGEPDPGYIYASELLNAGIPIYFYKMNDKSNNTLDDNDDPIEGGINVETAYEALAEIFASDSILYDKNEINIKYITSGGYPTFEYNGNSLVRAMANIAGGPNGRGDCVAIIDYVNNPDRSLTAPVDEDPAHSDYHAGSVYNEFNKAVSGYGAMGSFITMFFPWYQTGLGVTYPNFKLESGTTLSMPGSFGYLMSLAVSLISNVNWLAIAGVARGRVPNLIGLDLNSVLTNTIAESYTNNDKTSKVSINPITNIRPYGYCIWGNKTALNLSSDLGFATSFLNIRNLVSDVKKQVYIAAQSCLFEQNTDILWINFKALITPMLDQMVSGSGLKNYKIIKSADSTREIIKAKIVLIPVYAVEQFEIEIQITDEDVEVVEG